MALYVSYGFFLGLGLSFIYSPSLTIVGHYFRKRQYFPQKYSGFFKKKINVFRVWEFRFGVINGLVTCGSAVFTLLMYYLLDVLINNLGVSIGGGESAEVMRFPETCIFFSCDATITLLTFSSVVNHFFNTRYRD